MKKKLFKSPKFDSGSNMVESPKAVDHIIQVVIIVACGFIAFAAVIPMWHVLMASLSDGRMLMAHEGVLWQPVKGIDWGGYLHIFKDAGIIKGYINSIIYTVSATTIGFLVATTAGYAMSRQTRLKNHMIYFLMLTVLFNGGMVPTYMVIRSLGWVGTRWALIIPGCTNAIFMVMMMNAFNAVPKEMYEAARIDGASHFRTLMQIMLPQAMNFGSVIILNSVVMQWNSWLQAAIYVPNNKNLWPLQLWIRQITNENSNFLNSSNPDYTRYLIQYAVIVAATLPIILLFPFFQEKLEKGVITGGIKG